MSRIVLAGRSSIPTTDLDAMFSELYPFKGTMPANVQAGAYSAGASDIGGLVIAGGNVTMPAGVLGAGQFVAIYANSAGAISIVQGSGLLLRLGGTSTTGTRTLAGRGVAYVLYVNANEAIVFGGAGVS